MHDYGKGQVVYFANEAAKLNYTIGHPDYHDLLVNAVNTLLGNHEVLKTNAPASVHVYLNQRTKEQGTYQLSLVNTSSGSQRPIRDLIPVSGITIDSIRQGIRIKNICQCFNFIILFIFFTFSDKFQQIFFRIAVKIHMPI